MSSVMRSAVPACDFDIHQALLPISTVLLQIISQPCFDQGLIRHIAFVCLNLDSV